MPKRKLVEITPSQYRQFSTLRNALKKRGARVPSMPALVQSAIDRGMSSVIGEHTPAPLVHNER